MFRNQPSPVRPPTRLAPTLALGAHLACTFVAASACTGAIDRNDTREPGGGGSGGGRTGGSATVAAAMPAAAVGAASPATASTSRATAAASPQAWRR